MLNPVALTAIVDTVEPTPKSIFFDSLRYAISPVRESVKNPALVVTIAGLYPIIAPFARSTSDGNSEPSIDIPSATISVLQHEILGNTDKCYNCGLPGHFTNNCKKQTLKKEIVKEEYEYECDYCDRTFTTQFGCSVHEKSCQKTAVPECFRCGRVGHFKQDCYARTHENGYSL